MELRENVHVRYLPHRPPRPYHCVVARLAVKHATGPKFLDMGCGMGDIPNLIRKQRPDAQISIADAYQECLDRAQAKIGEVEATYLLPETKLSIDQRINDRFDVVTMSHVLEHMHDPITALRQILSIIKPGGHLVLAVPNPARPAILLINLFRKHYVNRGHVQAWDPSHWRNFLERIMGLDVIEYAGDFVDLLPTQAGRRIGVKVGPHFARALPWWCFSNIAVVRA